MNQKTYLILDTGSNLLKIGRSQNPNSRIKNMQIGCGSTLKLIHVFNADIEQILHYRFEKNRKHGEWFDVSASDVLYIARTDDFIKSEIKRQNPPEKNNPVIDYHLGNYSWLNKMKVGERSKYLGINEIQPAIEMSKICSKMTGKKFTLRKGKILRRS